jgi:hypothetical protein
MTNFLQPDFDLQGVAGHICFDPSLFLGRSLHNRRQVGMARVSNLVMVEQVGLACT